MNRTKKSTNISERLNKLIFEAVLMRVLPTLSKENITEYEKIIDSKEAGKTLWDFLKSKVPNFENIVKEEEEILRKELEK